LHVTGALYEQWTLVVPFVRAVDLGYQRTGKGFDFQHNSEVYKFISAAVDLFD
jgi:hypothetical protein